MARQQTGHDRRREQAVEQIAAKLLFLALPEGAEFREGLAVVCTRLGRGFGDALVSAAHWQGVPQAAAATMAEQALGAFVAAYQAMTAQRLRDYSPSETEEVDEEDEKEDSC